MDFLIKRFYKIENMTLLWVAFREEYPKQDFTMVNTIKSLVFYHEKIGRVRHFSQIPKNPSPKREYTGR